MNCEVFNIHTYKESQQFLEEHLEILKEELPSLIQKWLSQNWTDMDIMENSILQGLEKIVESLTSQDFNCLAVKRQSFVDTTRLCLESHILHYLYDKMIGVIYTQFKEEDDFLFDKCKTLNNKNVSIVDFGSSSEYAIALPASVVELANLDNHRTVLDKLNCLISSYDLIYAELKMALVEMIVESSNENDIPVINMSEVIPVLMGVIIKAKPKHLYSNFYYVEAFGRSLLEADHTRYILKTFQTAIQSIVDLKGVANRNCKQMDIFEYSKFAAGSMEVGNELEYSTTLQANQMRRFTRQVTASLEDITRDVS